MSSIHLMLLRLGIAVLFCFATGLASAESAAEKHCRAEYDGQKADAKKSVSWEAFSAMCMDEKVLPVHGPQPASPKPAADGLTARESCMARCAVYAKEAQQCGGNATCACLKRNLQVSCDDECSGRTPILQECPF